MAKSYIYTLDEIMIAARNTDGSYGSPVSLAADQMFTVEPQADTDQMRDSGQITRGLAVYTHATVTISAGGMDFDELVILEGGTKSTSGTTNRYQADSGGAGLPYFGAIGVANNDDGGKVVVGLPKVKLDTLIKKEFSGQENKFMINETSGVGFSDNGQVDVIKIYPNEATWLTEKPADGAAFAAWFSAVGYI